VELPLVDVRLSPHDWGVGVPVGQYAPIGHNVGTEPLPLQCKPAAHTSHVALIPFAPVKPALQWQSSVDEAPLADVRLTPHVIGSVTPLGQYDPMGHASGSLPSPSQFNPDGHVEHGKLAPNEPNSPAIQWQSLIDDAPISDVRLLPHDIGCDAPPPLLLDDEPSPEPLPLSESSLVVGGQ
jgi:hypothetical protein